MRFDSPLFSYGPVVIGSAVLVWLGPIIFDIPAWWWVIVSVLIGLPVAEFWYRADLSRWMGDD